MINWLYKIADLAELRVRKYGAQYLTFAIFGIINYPVAYLYNVYTAGSVTMTNFILRFASLLLCLILFFRNKWPNALKKFLPLYWYVTLMVSIPILMSFMLLENKFSLGWLINFNIGVMIFVLLLDSLSFIVIGTLGLIIGSLLFVMLGHPIPPLPNSEESVLFLYMFFCVTITGIIFSKNKEVFNHLLLKAVEDSKINLELLVSERTKELEKALAVKTDFLNNMSHEIRTPIQGFTNISKGLVSHWSDFTNKRRFDLAGQIANNAQRLLSLVGNLLDLAKITHDEMLLDVKPFNLIDLFKAMIDECTDFYLGNKEIKFELVGLKSCLINGDKERIGQVIRNLLGNSIKFTSSKTTITIEISESKKENGSILISIIDQGVGIPKKELKSIFNPFTQSNKTKTKAGGIGLGLSICNKIIEAHNGKIWAENNKKIGSKFNILLPRHSPNKKLSNDTVRVQSGEIDLKILNVTKNILAIDDEEACLTSLELLLYETSFKIIKANCGMDGLDYLQNNPETVDVIILDLMMPDIYGINLLKIIKDNKKLAHIPVILQSCISDETEIKRAFDYGIYDFVKKPYDRKTIVEAIVKALSANS